MDNPHKCYDKTLIAVCITQKIIIKKTTKFINSSDFREGYKYET